MAVKTTAIKINIKKHKTKIFKKVIFMVKAQLNLFKSVYFLTHKNQVEYISLIIKTFRIVQFLSVL